MSEDQILAACKMFKNGGSLTDIQRELKMSWGEANAALRWGLSQCDLDDDAIRSVEQYRKKYFPLSVAEAEREYANSPSIPLSNGERDEIVGRVTSKGAQATKAVRLVSVTAFGDALLAVDADGRLWRYGSNFEHTETGLVQFNSWSLADGPTTNDLPKEQAHDQATERDRL